ncbi:MAG: hypothetical protein MZV49_06915 [Rhodopseudomonas palustris]|nr:hypothetical protein [Rhodopseudomonas palustris]
MEIVGVDLNTCGGTHVRSTAEIEGAEASRHRGDARWDAALLRGGGETAPPARRLPRAQREAAAARRNVGRGSCRPERLGQARPGSRTRNATAEDPGGGAWRSRAHGCWRRGRMPVAPRPLGGARLARSCSGSPGKSGRVVAGP